MLLLWRGVGVRRREHCDLRELMSTISQNGYELVQQWLRVRRQELVVKCHLHAVGAYLWERTRSDNRLRRWSIF